MFINQNIYLQQLIDITVPSKYLDWYCQIISHAITRAKTKEEALSLFNYVEGHHILPRSFKLGGDRDQLNYAYLTAREHFVCHRLLAKIVHGQYKYYMLQACWLMCHVHLENNEYKISSRVYDLLKSSGPWNKGLIGLAGHSPTEEAKEHLRNLYKGKSRSDQDKQRMKDGWKKLKENGYTPWNKGKSTGKTSHSAIGCYFVDADGNRYEYPSVRQGCLAHKLPTSKMCEVNLGKLDHYKGWTIISINKSKDNI